MTECVLGEWVSYLENGGGVRGHLISGRGHAVSPSVVQGKKCITNTEKSTARTEGFPSNDVSCTKGWEGRGGTTSRREPCLARIRCPQAGGCICAWLQRTEWRLWPWVDSVALADPPPQPGSEMGLKPKQEVANVLVPAKVF